MNGNHTHKPRRTTRPGPATTTAPGPLAGTPEDPAQAQPAGQAPQDERTQDSLLRQAGRAAVLSLAGTPALIVGAVVERWLSTR
ncbi:hypothetical protein GCM10018781_80390 [Kitasatospora indigofera]|uniref:Uncharacterized protein n=1 Tax=Kitasatospora indigofera TaxID=67307 RepID=A0A918YXK6_9ACTN|nr:hypothetical protein [Kitasatospora indigofera]GHE27783.1 hypothetical protein GCM10018781_80390 [Kitasatospora indigofera]